MKHLAFVLSCILGASAAVAANAQVAPSATARQFSLTAGAMASAFQPDFDGNGELVPGSSDNWLFGAGAYVDMRFTRWVQLEAEARWLRINQQYGVHQDNYLVGPRIPIRRIWKGTVYGKALMGFSEASYGTLFSQELGKKDAHGRFTDFAFGGGMDMKITRRISFRAVDFEYQRYPTWYNYPNGTTAPYGKTALSPYGVSMGFGYKIF